MCYVARKWNLIVYTFSPLLFQTKQIIARFFIIYFLIFFYTLVVIRVIFLGKIVEGKKKRKHNFWRIQFITIILFFFALSMLLREN